MCLAVPGRVVRTWTDRAGRMASVDFDGVLRDCCTEFVPDLVVGDYTIIHLGFALQRLDAAEAGHTLALLRGSDPDRPS